MQIPLYKILEANGWHNEDNQMYPPHGTFWISGNDNLPIFMIEKMHENAKNTLQKIVKTSHLYFGKRSFQNCVIDLESFIKITREIISEN